MPDDIPDENIERAVALLRRQFYDDVADLLETEYLEND